MRINHSLTGIHKNTLSVEPHWPQFWSSCLVTKFVAPQEANPGLEAKESNWLKKKQLLSQHDNAAIWDLRLKKINQDLNAV